MDSSKKKRWEEVYERYSDDIYRMLLHLLQDTRYVDDIVHDTFLCFYEEMDHVKGKLLFPWLSHVARNLASNKYKRMQIAVEKEQKYTLSQGEECASVEEECIEKETCMELRKFRESIFTRLNREHPLWAEALLLVCVLEIPQTEVAKRLGVRDNVVHSRLHRARQWLEKHYRDEMESFFKERKGASYEETP